MMKHTYLLLKQVGLMMVFLAIASYACAQSTVSGTVTDAEDGSSIPGVNVLVKGTSTGTITDVEGNYSVTVTGPDATLVFSSVGFATQEVAVGSQTTVDLALEADVQALEEIVVTGYSTEERREVSGAVSTVGGEDLAAIPSGNVEQQLQGRVGGVTVITNGQPGTNSIVRVRGFGSFSNNRPLYVVDGVQVDGIDFIQPSDIESTTVLKDAASASIYGARAASGVIVVTTKQGYDGDLRVNYDGVFGVTLPGNVDNVLNPRQQMNAVWEAKRNTGIQTGNAPDFNSEQYGNGPNPVLPDYLVVGDRFGVVGGIDLEAQRALYNVDPSAGNIYQVMRANKGGTNWYDEITQPALLNRHMLSFAGGRDNSQYYLSLGMYDQEGILLYQRFQRYSVRLNSSHNIFDKFRIGENIQATYISRRGILGGENGLNAADDENDFLQAFRMPSIIPVYDEFGGYAGTAAKGFNNPRNPVASRERSKDNNNSNYFIFGNVFAEFEPFEGLNLRSSFGGSVGQGYSFFYTRPSYENSENNSTFTYGEDAFSGRDWIFTNTAQYQRDFGVHSISLLAGVESLNLGYFRSISGRGQEPFSRDLEYITLTNTVNRTVDSEYNTETRFFSIFGQAKYIYNDKYILTGVLRRDGSSRFAASNRYGVFPAVSAAWRISEEPFMAGATFIDDLKIRGGWGQMGNSNGISPANQFSLYRSDLAQSYYDIGGTNGAPVEGFYRSRIGNDAAKWETAITTNIGVDATLLDGRLDVIVDVWRKDTEDLLYALETPDVVGPEAESPSINIASMRNQGVDLQIIGRGNLAPDLTFKVDVTGSFLQNEIQSIAPGVTSFGNDVSFRGIRPLNNQVGNPISSFYGYKVLGLFQDEEEVANSPEQDGKGVGRFRFEDNNGRGEDGELTGVPDGVVNEADQTYLGDPVPDFTGGVNLELDYKGFELIAFMQLTLGADIFNLSRWFTDFYPSFTGAAYGKRVLDAFTFEEGGNTTPIFENVSNFSTNTQSNSYYVENGDYARLANLQLGYTLPSELVSRYNMEKVKVYLQSTNLLVITNYAGLDPSVAGDADTRFGIDIGNPPITKAFNVGLQVTF